MPSLMRVGVTSLLRSSFARSVGRSPLPSSRLSEAAHALRSSVPRPWYPMPSPAGSLQVRSALTAADGWKPTWNQTTSEVTICLPVPEGVKGRDVNVEVHPRRLKVEVHGYPVLQGPFVEGSDEPMVDPDGCFWAIEDMEDGEGRCIKITLDKKEMGHESWQDLIAGEAPDISFTNYVYFNIQVGEEQVGRIVMGLFGNVVPKTTANFLELCRGTGESATGKKLTYKGSPMHRIIPRFMAQGGDITMGDGTGGESMYGKRFEDENFVLKHSSAGMLSMANAGPDTNGSQFFILFEPQPHLDGKHVVFGQVVDEDSMKVVRRLEDLGTRSGAPKLPVMISDCGELTQTDEEGTITPES